MENTPELTTERLLLRKFHESDAQSYLSFFCDPAVAEYFPMYPLKTLEEAMEHMRENYLNHYREPEGYHYAVCLKQDQIPIGFIDINDNGSYEIGYGLHQNFWHRGIITEGCRAVLKRMRLDGITFVTSTHDVKNPRSGNVMKKLGMTYRYTFQDFWETKNRLCTFRMYQLNFNQQDEYIYWKYWERYPMHFIEDGI